MQHRPPAYMDRLLIEAPALSLHIPGCPHHSYSRTMEEHYDHLRQFFYHPSSEWFADKPCVFADSAVAFLGHFVDQHGRRPLQHHVQTKVIPADIWHTPVQENVVADARFVLNFQLPVVEGTGHPTCSRRPPNRLNLWDCAAELGGTCGGVPTVLLRRWTWTGDFKCREVKTGFCRNRSMQTGSSGTLIGWKSGGKPLLFLYGTEWRERGYGLWPTAGSHVTCTIVKHRCTV